MIRKWLSQPLSSVKNAEVQEFVNDTDALNRWTIPSVPAKKIYEIGTFDFKSQHTIKTVEQTVTLEGAEEQFQLLAPQDIQRYKGQGYNFIHIGLVQIALKPLTLSGLNASILAILRDARCLDWKPSLMGIAQTSLSHGPIYFNVYPNLSLSLSDPNILEAVHLKLQSYGYNFTAGSETIGLISRVHYKVLNTLCPKARHSSFPGHTVMIQSNLLTTKIATNKLLKWDDIQFPETWVLPEAVPPRPIIRTDVDQIIQHEDGEIEVSFNQSQRIRLTTSHSNRNLYQVSEPSTSRGRASTSSIPVAIPVHLDGIQMSQQQIPHGIYTPESNRLSPTQSEMSFQV